MWRRPPLATSLPDVARGGLSLANVLDVDRALVTMGGVAWGGVGKSEVALWIAARWARDRKRYGKVAFISHGYRGRSPRPERVLLPQRAQLTEVERAEALERWGDEALMASWRAPEGVEVWAGGAWLERVQWSERQGATHLICDGGLYRRELSPTAQLCLFDPNLRPRLFPLGDLCRPTRHFPHGVSWWAHGSQARNAPLPLHFQSCAPIIAQSDYHNLSLLSPSGERVSSEFLKGKTVEPWLGTARPQRLLNRLRALGASLLDPVQTRNHRPFPTRTVQNQLASGVLRVCTYKDLPRLPVDLEVYVLEPNLYVEERGDG